ncbi:MAG TPA: hypothetical protein VI076_12480, partial [Actinopolymorphaceae bacterium]
GTAWWAGDRSVGNDRPRRYTVGPTYPDTALDTMARRGSAPRLGTTAGTIARRRRPRARS